ncbi:hypothetical protein Ddye_002750 [Dipteronia dyeriana]|uniref:Uncharacterized protein n=1 Tax=Dipteronia dyeriana TaxID=168575 RepID=A0AAD9XRJ9_9ROSI|nr:hypothetical protein Ddye_002750 [Dipteronia dyeriana]
MTHVQAFKAIIDELGRQGLMVVIDNHVSNPKWCCAEEDRNGFFGDVDFYPLEWERGLVIIAQQFSSISLRNKLCGPRQNVFNWFKYVPIGASSVHNDGDQPVPLFLSEFGFDQTGRNEGDKLFINYFLTAAANITAAREVNLRELGSGALESMLAEGLDRKPLREIVAMVAEQ